VRRLNPPGEFANSIEVSGKPPSHAPKGHSILVDGVDCFAHYALSVNGVLREKRGLDAEVVRAGTTAMNTNCDQQENRIVEV
jgi:hypothetical protein